LSRPVRQRLAFGQFSLAFLLALMTAVAVGVRYYRNLPDLVAVLLSSDGILAMLLLLIPPLGRTAVAEYLRRSRGGYYSLLGFASSFRASLGTTIPVLAIAYAAWLAGWALGILTSPVWTNFVDWEYDRGALVPAAVFALAGAGYGFWITRPHE
jgi:hypothetical protein